MRCHTNRERERWNRDTGNHWRSMERQRCSKEGILKTKWAQKNEGNKGIAKLSLIKEGMRYKDSRGQRGMIWWVRKKNTTHASSAKISSSYFPCPLGWLRPEFVKLSMLSMPDWCTYFYLKPTICNMFVWCVCVCVSFGFYLSTLSESHSEPTYCPSIEHPNHPSSP